MELFVLYLWLKLDTIIGMLAVSAGILFAITSFCWACVADGNGDKNKFEKSKWKLISTAIVFSVLATIIPSQKDMAILVGGHYALKITQSPEADKFVSVLRKKANEMLDEQLREKK